MNNLLVRIGVIVGAILIAGCETVLSTVAGWVGVTSEQRVSSLVCSDDV